ncbi:hypothetical protein XI06_14160 [Bradyrhizobium sp. CCBAU 11434]|nr:hypothetical protein [Bradyrhizobium sp. CCBAU 11434]
MLRIAGDAALRPGHETVAFGHTCINTVIANVAKQSRVFLRWQSGLLRYARNDGVRCIGIALLFASSSQTHFRILGAHLARVLLHRLTLL